MGPRTRTQAPLSPTRPRSRSPDEVVDTWSLRDGKKRTYEVIKKNAERHAFLTLTPYLPSTHCKDRYKRVLDGDLEASNGFAQDLEASREAHGSQKPDEAQQSASSDHKTATVVKQDTIDTQQAGASAGEQRVSLEAVHSLSQEKNLQPSTVYPAFQESCLQLGYKPLQPTTAIPGLQIGFEPSAVFVGGDKVPVLIASDQNTTLTTPQHHPGKLVLRIPSIQPAEAYAPPRPDSPRTVAANNSTTGEDQQPLTRGLKRSRTSEPPSLTSGPTSIQTSPQSSVSGRSSPTRRASPKKRGSGRPRKAASLSTLSAENLRQKIVTLRTAKLPRDYVLDSVTMAPVRDPNDVSNKIKDVIQNLYDVQSQTHGFVPETQELLIDKMAELTQSLSDLQRLADKTVSPNNPVHEIDLAPEIVDYVDDGRNPDIFTRDFVELVQRGNAVLNGKQQAFRDFSQIYARKLKEGIGGVGRHVDMVMENAGIAIEETEKGKVEREGLRAGQENGEKKE